ncbi:MAG: hypothetical protein CML13_12285 [Puniceicoccaceae bacterium]|nr:hypothetical protein [Puniceicoccaceae bacterium]
MSPLIHSTRALSALLIGLSTFSGLAQAGVAVEFDSNNDYVSYDYDFERSAQTLSSSPYSAICPFDAHTPLLQNSEYYKGPSLYGAYQISSSITEGPFSRQQIRNHKGKADAITLQSYSGQSWDGSEISLSALFLFKQADFLPGFQQGDFHLESFNCQWSTYFKGRSRDVTGRYLVQIGDAYYLSNYTFNMTNRGSDLLSAGMLGSVKWAAYNPIAKLNFDQEQAQFTELELSAVTAVGIYLEDDYWVSDGSVSSPYLVSIYGFKASGTIKP